MQGKKQTKLAAFLSFTGEPWSCQLQYCSQAVNSVSVVSNNPLALLHTFQSIYNICSRAEGTDLPPSVYPPSCSMRFERCKPLCTRSFVWRPNQPNLPTSWLVCTRVLSTDCQSLFFHFLVLSSPVLKMFMVHLGTCLILEAFSQRQLQSICFPQRTRVGGPHT